jgi:hypothetical protein
MSAAEQRVDPRLALLARASAWLALVEHEAATAGLPPPTRYSAAAFWRYGSALTRARENRCPARAIYLRARRCSCRMAICSDLRAHARARDGLVGQESRHRVGRCGERARDALSTPSHTSKSAP